MLHTAAAVVVERAASSLLPTDPAVFEQVQPPANEACNTGQELLELAHIARARLVEIPHLERTLAEARRLHALVPDAGAGIHATGRISSRGRSRTRRKERHCREGDVAKVTSRT